MINIKKWKEDKQRPDEEGSILPIRSKVSIAEVELKITFHRHRQKQQYRSPINLRKLVKLKHQSKRNNERIERDSERKTTPN